MRRLYAARVAVAGLAVLLAAGCGGSPTFSVLGGTSSNQTSIGTTPTTISTTTGSVTTSVSLPGATSGSSSVTVTQSTSPPSGAPALQSDERRTLSAAGTPIVYVSMVFASTVTLPSLPGFTFTIGTPAANTAYLLGFLDPAKGTSYQLAAEGPGTIAGTSVTLSAPPGSVTFTTGTTYVFVLYSTTLSPVVPSATSLSFTALGAVAAQTFTVSETGFTGSFTATSSNTSVATVSGPTGTTPTFTVTPVSGGSATITVADTQGQKASVTVTVTSATFVTQ
jgi:hypothetical protein